MKSIFVYIFIAFLFLISCDNQSGEKSNELLPKASGSAGELLVVMDSAQWQGTLGDEIRNTFMAEVEGLPREEYLFKINRVDPKRINSVLKNVKNMLFVVTLDSNTPDSRVVKNYFTKSSVKKIKEDSSIYVYTMDEVYAKNQKVMYLFGQTQSALIKKIKANRGRLTHFFDQAENERLKKGLFKAKEKSGITDLLVEKHDCYMRIPFGYKLVLNEPGFIWARQINNVSDKNIFISYVDYKSESMLTKESIIAYRDSVARNQLFEDPEDPNTHLLTETTVPFIPVQSNYINFNGQYAMKTIGLWKTNNMSMGGPFVSYSIIDEEMNRFYYIEGFLYSPGKNQREYMRELEVILSTFRTKANLPKGSK